MEEIASARQAAQAAERQAIERQYAAQAHALATDPLVRLQVKFILDYMNVRYFGFKYIFKCRCIEMK